MDYTPDLAYAALLLFGIAVAVAGSAALPRLLRHPLLAFLAAALLQVAFLFLCRAAEAWILGLPDRSTTYGHATYVRVDLVSLMAPLQALFGTVSLALLVPAGASMLRIGNHGTSDSAPPAPSAFLDRFRRLLWTPYVLAAAAPVLLRLGMGDLIADEARLRALHAGSLVLCLAIGAVAAVAATNELLGVDGYRGCIAGIWAGWSLVLLPWSAIVLSGSSLARSDEYGYFRFADNLWLMLVPAFGFLLQLAAWHRGTPRRNQPAPDPGTPRPAPEPEASSPVPDRRTVWKRDWREMSRTGRAAVALATLACGCLCVLTVLVVAASDPDSEANRIVLPLLAATIAVAFLAAILRGIAVGLSRDANELSRVFQKAALRVAFGTLPLVFLLYLLLLLVGLATFEFHLDLDFGMM